MKTLYTSVLAIVASVVFTSEVGATPLPAWDNVINGPARFRVLNDFDGQAVLDKETGLVWERQPTFFPNWVGAHTTCNQRIVANRGGWRLPTVNELTSLLDKTQSDPALPPGHPFAVAPPFLGFWSATSYAGDINQAWFVSFVSNGSVTPSSKNSGTGAWCVRTGHGGPDAQ